MVNAKSPTADFNRVQVRYDYIGWDASVIGGTVTFTPRVTRAIDSAVKTIIIARPITGTIGSDGTGSVLLPAGDDPDINVNFTYQVTENFEGGDTYDIAVPIAAEATGLDLATVPRTYVVTAPNGQFAVTQAQFDSLASQVAALSTASVSDATTTTKGVVALAGDLAGTAASPTVPGLAAKANTSSLGTAAAKNTGTTSGTVPLLGTGGLLPIARIATGTPDGTKFVRDDGTLASAGSSGSSAGTFLFSSAVASISTSAAVSVASAVTVGACRLSCTGAPVGSALTVVLQKSTDGTTWTTVQSLTVTAGTTTTATATAAAALASGSLVRVNATSVGSTTAATGVLFQADYA